MTETPIADRLASIADRAETDIRNESLRGILLDMLDAMHALADRMDAQTEPVDGITREQLSRALGGAAFLASLGNLLDRIASAREADVESVLRYVLGARHSAPQTRPSGPDPTPPPAP